MKKWLIGCLMALAMVCLMGMTANAETIRTTCYYCEQYLNHEIQGYERYNDDQHWVIYICSNSNCGRVNKQIVVGSEFDKHTGGTETPTCTTGKTCSKCGAHYGVLGHDWGEWKSSGNNGTHTHTCKRCKTVETANCGGDGSATCVKLGICTTCGGQYYGGHAFPARWDWRSDTEVGRDAEKHWLRCLNCTEGKAYVSTHSFGQGNLYLKSEATCVSKAVYHVNCGTCYYKGTETYEYQWGNTNPNNHDGAQYGAKAATCTEAGWEAYEACKREGCNYTTKTEIPASGHEWGEWTSNGDGTHTRACTHDSSHTQTDACSGGKATCTEKAVCSVCKSAYGNPLDHDWSAWMSNGNGTHTRVCKRDSSHTQTDACSGGMATCTEKAVCSVCKSAYGNPLGHDKVHHDAKAPTCLEKGWKAYDTCTRCDYTTYQELKALGHDKVHHDAKNPTCLDIGWYAYDTCTRCAYSTRLIRPALGHDLVKHAAKNPTCTEIGWNAYNTCTRCSYTTYQEKAALGHDKVHHDAKDATCLEIGWKEYDTCSRCDYTTYEELKALGHDKVRHEAKAPTCLEIGWKAYDTCSRCDYTTYEELPALGHDYKERVHAVTCEKDGYTSHNCSRCGDRYVTDRVAKLNHWFGEWTPVEETTHEATCLREGCGFAANVDCETIEFALALEGQEPLTLSLCPVCGRVEGGESLLLENVTAEAVKGYLPLGEAFARLFTLEGGEKVLLVGFEYGGKLAKADCPVKITLPAEALAGCSLSLIESDGTLTALEIAIDGELATFELDFTNAESPIALIRLLPAA